MAKKDEFDESIEEEVSSESENGSDGDSESERRVRRFVTDTIKKVFTVGVGAAFLTEESIRRYLNDIKLPKEVLGTLLQGANKSKEELMNVVTNEVVNVIKKIDVVQEASRFVEEHKFKISAEIEVVKKTGNEESTSQTNASQQTIQVKL